MRYWIILAVLVIAGCGQKGALYMPEDKSETKVNGPAQEERSEAPAEGSQ